MNSTYRNTWKKQKPVAVAAPRAGTQERHLKGVSHTAGASSAVSNNGTLLRGSENPHAVGGSISAMAGAIGGAPLLSNGAIGIGNGLSGTPRKTAIRRTRSGPCFSEAFQRPKTQYFCIGKSTRGTAIPLRVSAIPP